jgi:mRNA interferase MazF
MPSESVPDAGDILWVDFGWPVGREQAGRRPAVVLTPHAHNARSSVILVCPITRTHRQWPYHVPLPSDDPLEGFVLADQIRVIDPAVRASRPAGRLSDTVLAEVKGKIAVLLQIPVTN